VRRNHLKIIDAPAPPKRIGVNFCDSHKLVAINLPHEPKDGDFVIDIKGGVLLHHCCDAFLPVVSAPSRNGFGACLAHPHHTCPCLDPGHRHAHRSGVVKRILLLFDRFAPRRPIAFATKHLPALGVVSPFGGDFSAWRLAIRSFLIRSRTSAPITARAL
jgi:hypothetical protein